MAMVRTASAAVPLKEGFGDARHNGTLFQGRDYSGEAMLHITAATLEGA